MSGLLKSDLNDAKNLSMIWGFLCIALFISQLDTQHLILVTIGAGTYTLLQLKIRRDQPPPKKVCSVYYDEDERRPWRRGDDRREMKPPYGRPPRNPNPSIGIRHEPKPTPLFSPPAPTASAKPLQAPVFNAHTFEGEVKELLKQILPTKASEEGVKRLTQVARQAITGAFPEAEVFGFALGDISRGTAFGVAVPEVDILVKCSPEVLLQRLQVRLQRGGTHSQPGADKKEMSKMIDERKIQKSAIRTCTDILVEAGFKFRRSAFRGEEPKVTLLMPPTEGVCMKAIPVDFSVNIITPVYNSALMQVASAVDPRVLQLGLLVKRWSKDRGVCHAAKGHLSPYAWHLLCIFFLQCLGDEENKEGMLPAFNKWDWSNSPVGNKMACLTGGDAPPWTVPEEYAGIEAPELLKRFFQFYRYRIDWSNEGVSLHLASRGRLPKRMKTTVIQPTDNDDSVYVPEYTFGDPSHALSIEDPWEPTRNLSADLTYFALSRMKEELCRACYLCEENASLAELLVPWVPPGSPDGCENDDCVERDSFKSSAARKALNTAKKQDALKRELYRKLKERGEEQARRATEQLLQELRTDVSPGDHQKKADQIISVLKDEEKLNELLKNAL